MASMREKLDRIRPPRVRITYDVETGDAISTRELPFVMGIMGNFSGMQVVAKPRIKDRKFIAIDQDNFNTVLKSMTPRVTMRVANKLTNNNATMDIELIFQSINDFAPLAVIKQIPALAQLYNVRLKLRDLLTKIEGNETLDDMLRDLINNPENAKALRDEISAATKGA